VPRWLLDRIAWERRNDAKETSFAGGEGNRPYDGRFGGEHARCEPHSPVGSRDKSVPSGTSARPRQALALAPLNK